MDIQLEEEKEFGGGTTVVVFPKVQGVDIQLLNVTRRTEQNSQENPSIQESMGIAQITDVKCVLLFGVYVNVSSIPQLAPKLQKSFRETCSWEPVIAGGVADGFVTWPDSTKLQHVNGLVFSGPNVQAASIALNMYCEVRSKECVKQRLQQLKNIGLSERNSIAFMFGFLHRKPEVHEQENVESIAFHEVFPNTPLFGFFGSGQIGCDNFACGKANDKGEEASRLADYDSIFTPATVFCLLSFGQAT